MMRVHVIPVLFDNYCYVAVDVATGATAVVDPPDAGAVNEFLAREGLKLNAVWLTHHHLDHIAGAEELRETHGVEVVAYRGDAHRIKAANRWVEDGSQVRLGSLTVRVLLTPGHTTGHIAYVFDGAGAGAGASAGASASGEGAPALFCGDTLFTGGCGRLFEGTAEELSATLSEVFGALPDATRVYCGHEYAESNLAFGLTVEPHNAALVERARVVGELRAKNGASVPSTLGVERATNVFLRCERDEVVAFARSKRAGVTTRAGVFGVLRACKDEF